MDRRNLNHQIKNRTMDYATKDKLIQDLAKAMGMHGGMASKSANFDAATGTLYVGSKVYKPEQIQSAREFFESQVKKYEPLGDDTYEMFEIAAISIELAQNLQTTNRGNIVIKA